MSYSLQLRLKNGTYQDAALPETDAGTLAQAFEDEQHKATFDDLSLTLDNTDGAFTALFCQANLPPTDAYPACYGFRVLQDGVPFWEGDLDYSSVEHDDESDTTQVTVTDALARLSRHNAENLQRDYSAIAIVSGPKNKKTLTVNSVLDAAGEAICAGDTLSLGHAKPNGKLATQDLEVYSVDVGTNVITFKKRMKTNFLAGEPIIVKDPWYRGHTASWVLGRLFDLVPGFDSMHRVIDYDGATWSDIIDVADFNGKDVGAAVQLVADWINAKVFSKVNTVRVIGRGREADATPVKALDTLVGAGSAVLPVGGPRYDLVVIKGREGRQVRKGIEPFNGEKLEKEFPFSKDRTLIKAVADRYWDYWGRYREQITSLPLDDDGTAYTLGKRVSIGGVVYEVDKASSELEDKGELSLDLLAESGTLVDPGAYDQDDLVDDDSDPPEPSGFVFTKAYTVMWESLFPAAKYPRTTIIDIEVVSTNPLVLENKLGRLYELHWAYPYDELQSMVWRFEVTIWPDGQDREKPHSHLAVVPAIQSDGLYYAKVRLPAGKIWWADVQAVLYDLREGLISDPNNSTSEDDTGYGGTDAPPVIAGVTLASALDDIPGTPGKECDLDAIVSWTGAATKLQLEVTKPNGKVVLKTMVVSGKASPQTVHISRRFKRGMLLTVAVIGQNGMAFTAPYDAGTVTAGGSAIPTPTAPTISSVTHTKRGSLVVCGISSDAGAGMLQLFTAATGTISNPDSAPSVWHKVSHTDITDDMAAGRTSVDCHLQRVDASRKAVIARIKSRYDATVSSAWSAISDSGTVPGSDDVAPGAVSVSLQSPLDDIPGTTRKEASLGVTISISGGGADRVKAVFQDATSARKFTVGSECNPADTSVVVWIEKKLHAGHTINTLTVRAWNGTAYTNATYLPSIVAGSGTVSGGIPAAPGSPSVVLIAGTKSPHHAEFTVSWTANVYLKTLFMEKYESSTWKKCDPIEIGSLARAGITSTIVKVHFKRQDGAGGGTIPDIRAKLRDSYDQESAYGTCTANGTQSSPLNYFQNSNGQIQGGNIELTVNGLTQNIQPLFAGTAAYIYLNGSKVWPRPAISNETNLPTSEIGSGLIIPLWQASGSGAARFRLAVYFPNTLTGVGGNKWAIYQADSTRTTDAASESSTTGGTGVSGGGCVALESLILLDDGSSMKLSDLQGSESLLGLDPMTGRPEPQFIGHVFQHTELGKVPLISLCGLGITPNHLVCPWENGAPPADVPWFPAERAMGRVLRGIAGDGAPNLSGVVSDAPAGLVGNLDTRFHNYFASGNQGKSWVLVHNLKDPG